MRRSLRIFGLTLVISAGISWGPAGGDQVSPAPEPRGPDGSSTLLYQPPRWPEAPDTSAMLTRLAIGTITVLGLSVVTLWAGRRWLRGQPPNATAAGQLRLVDSIALGSRCSLYLVQAGQRQVLAGVDGAGLKSLVTLTEPFEAALADAELPRIGPGDHELADRATPQPAAAEL